LCRTSTAATAGRKNTATTEKKKQDCQRIQISSYLLLCIPP
jgi:hypothetical protein